MKVPKYNIVEVYFLCKEELMKITDNNSLKLIQITLIILFVANPTLAVDSLESLNSSTASSREYNFNSSDQVYTLQNPLGNTGVGEFKINGVSNNASKSVLDLNNNRGFTLPNNIILEIIIKSLNRPVITQIKALIKKRK